MASSSHLLEPPKFGVGGPIPFKLWKNLVKNYLGAYKLEEDAQKVVLFKLLEGKALEIFVKIPGVDVMTFEEQINLLEERLCPSEDDRLSRAKFWAAQPGSEKSPQLYADYLQLLASKAFINDKEMNRNVLEKFIDTVLLPSALSRVVLLQANFGNINDAIKFIQSWYAAEKHVNRCENLHGRMATLSVSGADHDLGQDRQVAALDSSKGQFNTNKTLTCFFCGRQGHAKKIV